MKQKIINNISKQATGRNVLILLVTYLVFQISIILFVTPAWTRHSKELLLDARINYNSTEVYSFINCLTDSAKYLYLQIGIFDSLFAIIYSLFFTFLIQYLFDKAFLKNSILYKFRFLPLLVGLADILENISIRTMLIGYPAQYPAVAGLANIFTLSKFVLTPVSLLLVLLALTIFLIRRKTVIIIKK